MGELITLLTTFSPLTIIICCLMILIAFKAVVQYRRWLEKLKEQVYNRRREEERQHEIACGLTKDHDEQLRKISNSIQGIQRDLDVMSDKINTLTQSDKDDIKAYITDKYHYFYEQQGWIDDYSMDCIERRFAHYQKEGGNSFIELLMEKLRSLPCVKPDSLLLKDAAAVGTELH